MTDLVIPNYTVIDELSAGEGKNLNYLIISEGNEEIRDMNTHLAGNNLIGIYLPKSLKKIENPDCIPYSGVKLYVYEGSYAHKFAEKNGYIVKLVKPIDHIELSAESLDLRIKKTANIKAIVQPKNATSKRLVWFSSDDLVATVKDGKVTAVDEGECDIYCRGLDSGLKTAICHVTVTK